MAISSISGSSNQFQVQSNQPESLTTEQQEKIASILSEYDPENLTEEDAQSIFEAFEEAGIKPGPGMKEAIEAAGFDAEELRSLAPPPENGSAPPPPSANSSSGVDREALGTLQEILDQYDFSDMSSESESALIEQLQSSGLLVQGNILDISA